jgi:hypothetical protein
MINFFNDDKNLVIMAVLILGLAVIWSKPLGQNEITIISSLLSGLFGIAVGRSNGS